MRFDAFMAKDMLCARINRCMHPLGGSWHFGFPPDANNGSLCVAKTIDFQDNCK